MILRAIERRIQPYISPRWIEMLRVQKYRRIRVSKLNKNNEITQLFLDLSVISKSDAGTGIQRVTRSIACELLKKEQKSFLIQTVRADRKNPFHIFKWGNDDNNECIQKILRGKSGDIFLGLDYSLTLVCKYKKQLYEFKKRGGKIWFVVHDLLPIQYPRWFSDSTVVRYRKWLRTIASLGDGFLCVSEVTEKELRKEFSARYALDSGFETAILPLGWDLSSAYTSHGISPDLAKLISTIANKSSVLMVGTIEPRKGHADILSAFDLLWGANYDCSLIIVGKPGWKTSELQERIQIHEEFGHRLFWIQDASDEALIGLYKTCNGMIMASYAEGFGLPMIEAIGYGKPVLARDIPVFRSFVKYGRVSYFDSDSTSTELANSIQMWIEKNNSSKIQDHNYAQLNSWDFVAETVLSILRLNNNER
jgi:glycosyltransferase involved in cell wall biosynthesis